MYDNPRGAESFVRYEHRRQTGQGMKDRDFVGAEGEGERGKYIEKE